MAKKKQQSEIKMGKEQIEKIEQLSFKIEETLNEMKLSGEKELEIFAEAIALTIIRFGRESQWPAYQVVSYAGYVVMNFMEHGITAEIQKLEEYIKSSKMETVMKGMTGN